ncbi:MULTISPECIES: hypothetical protein [Tenacibaculum]|uniref:hypothetical protein n=1 Tax=Tenacibaculum TaxID=104267 RepID=UPI00089B3E44|nr:MULTISPECIES: hypothetical protein [unclassified Tenacibaculum]RBW61393.1 hypothetical protein DS884_03530 [Tenacibaculum sp. E3R01]SEE35387.1 hypothetical protein SAMN04487765_2248 [Tenacibaculum sp. MAR_2010_89]
MITDFTLKKLSFEYVAYDTLLSGIHYNFNHPTKGAFTALMPDKYSKIEIDSVDLSVNLIFNDINDLKEWVAN